RRRPLMKSSARLIATMIFLCSMGPACSNSGPDAPGGDPGLDRGDSNRDFNQDLTWLYQLSTDRGSLEPTGDPPSAVTSGLDIGRTGFDRFTLPDLTPYP